MEGGSRRGGGRKSGRRRNRKIEKETEGQRRKVMKMQETEITRVKGLKCER